MVFGSFLFFVGFSMVSGCLRRVLNLFKVVQRVCGLPCVFRWFLLFYDTFLALPLQTSPCVFLLHLRPC